MTRFTKAIAVAAVFGVAGVAAAQSPQFKPLPKQVPPVKILPHPMPLPTPQPVPQPAPQWKLGVRIAANPGGGLYLHEVFAGSPAELAGLRAGMVLLTVDGVLYNDPLAARDKVMFGSGDAIDLVYQDGAGFYQVTAQLSTITMMMAPAPGTPAVKRVVPQLKNLKRVKVADPRKK